MNFKKLLSAVLSSALVLTPVTVMGTGASVNAAAKNISLGMITDTGGLGDGSFNDIAWEGLTKFGKKYSVKPIVIQSQKESDYDTNIATMARNNVDLTFCVGYKFVPAVTKAADQYKNKKFCIIDDEVKKSNVASIKFKENESSFLGGVVAAKTTKTKIVGFIGGMTSPLIKKFEVGFRAGVAAVNPKIKVIVNYAEAFDNSDKGKTIALTQHKQGADVIFHAAGATGLGLIAAAEDQKFWAIGVDQDQSVQKKKGKKDTYLKNVLCSVIKRVDTAVLKVAEGYRNGKFPAGKTTVYGLKDDGVGLSDKAGNTPKAVMAAADKYKLDIMNGKIVAPSTEAELSKFMKGLSKSPKY
jgi:basic membrane protein A